MVDKTTSGLTDKTEAKKSILPDFLKRQDGSKIGSPEEDLKSAEKDAAKEVERPDGGAENVGASESSPRGFYRPQEKKTESGFRGGDLGGKIKSVGKIKKKAPLIAIGLIIVFVLVLASPELPKLAIGAIKENLIRSLGFKDTVAILEEQGEHVTSEFMANGKMPEKYSSDLLAQGIETGQVTVAGEFVRTNEYIADLGSEVAAEGEYVANGNGELALRFNGEIITADNFVAKVESDPVLYAAYSKAADISARYYYSDAVNTVYNNMGLSRGSFNNWKATGNADEDQKSFKETLDKTLDKESNRTMSGHYWQWHSICLKADPKTGKCIYWIWDPDDVKWECSGGGSSWACTLKQYCPYYDIEYPVESTSISGDPKAVSEGIISYIESHSRHDTNNDNPYASGGPIVTSAEENTTQTLNTVLSADEPYRAASDFMSLMEALERAQIVGDGPVNEMMNILSRPNEVSYLDVNSKQIVTEKTSILETHNFQMAVSENNSYSKTEAENLSRDRILKVTDTARKEAIENIPLSTDGKKKSGDGVDMENNYYDCSPNTYGCDRNNYSATISGKSYATESLKMGMADKNSKYFATSIGANRILEGGSFISNSINQQVIGAMPSDAAQVALYRQEVNTVLARQAEADRATKSPFDVSSPNTFMGSLVRKLAIATLGNYNSIHNSWLVQTASAVGSLASNSIKNLAVGAVADGNDIEFTAMNGECSVVPTTGAVCDLYGTSHNTVSTKYMNYTESQWESAVNIGDVEKFVNQGMKRDATVGIKSYEVCTSGSNSSSSGTSSGGGIWNKIKGFFAEVVASIKKVISVVTGAVLLDGGCKSVSDDVATGSEYVLKGGQDDDTAKLSGYALHSAVYSLLEDNGTNTQNDNSINNNSTESEQ